MRMQFTEQKGKERHFIDRPGSSLSWRNQARRVPVPPFGAEVKMCSREQFANPIRELSQHDLDGRIVSGLDRAQIPNALPQEFDLPKITDHCHKKRTG